MLKRNWSAIALALAFAALSGPAYPQTAAICAMPKEEAAKSPLCVRYFFTCEATGVPAQGAGIYANLSMEDRQRLMLFAVFTLAERTCEQFNYEEALAAMQAKMFGFSTSTSTRAGPTR